MYIVEGLTNRSPSTPNRTSPCQRDVGAEIGHVISRPQPEAAGAGEDIWIPAQNRATPRCWLGALGEWITRPTAQLRDALDVPGGHQRRRSS